MGLFINYTAHIIRFSSTKYWTVYTLTPKATRIFRQNESPLEPAPQTPQAIPIWAIWRAQPPALTIPIDRLIRSFSRSAISPSPQFYDRLSSVDMFFFINENAHKLYYAPIPRDYRSIHPVIHWRIWYNFRVYSRTGDRAGNANVSTAVDCWCVYIVHRHRVLEKRKTSLTTPSSAVTVMRSIKSDKMGVIWTCDPLEYGPLFPLKIAANNIDKRNWTPIYSMFRTEMQCIDMK